MPVLKDFRQTKKISLKEYPESEVEIFNSVLARDGDVLMELQKNPESIAKLIKVLPKFIKSWNFQNDKEELLPITSDSINLLSFEALTEIVDGVKEFSDSLKKN